MNWRITHYLTNATDFFKWFLMGVCDVIPGISWWTIAFITGIYDRLLDALNAINTNTLRLFLQGQWARVWTTIDGWFLVRVLSGIVIAIISVAALIQHLLVSAPIALWGFFWWLIAMSSIMLIVGEYKTMRLSGRPIPWHVWLWMILGWIIGRWVSRLPMMQSWSGLVTYFLSGALAICAMILPGISGSYILVILGKYKDILTALTNTIDHISTVISSWISGWSQTILWQTILSQTILSQTILSQPAALWIPDMTIIAVFILWTITWLLLFSKLLHWIKVRYHTVLVMLMTWFMVWSLGKIRPRQTVVSTYVDRHGDVQTLQTSLSLPATSADALRWTGMILVGIGIIGLVWWKSRSK